MSGLRCVYPFRHVYALPMTYVLTRIIGLRESVFVYIPQSRGPETIEYFNIGQLWAGVLALALWSSWIIKLPLSLVKGGGSLLAYGLFLPPKLQIRPSKSALPEVGIGHLHVFKASKWFYCINEVESHRSSHRLQLTKSSRLNPKESAEESNDSPNGTELETEAQRGQVTCLRTHNFQVA